MQASNLKIKRWISSGISQNVITFIYMFLVDVHIAINKRRAQTAHKNEKWNKKRTNNKIDEKVTNCWAIWLVYSCVHVPTVDTVKRSYRLMGWIFVISHSYSIRCLPHHIWLRYFFSVSFSTCFFRHSDSLFDCFSELQAIENILCFFFNSFRRELALCSVLARAD